MNEGDDLGALIIESATRIFRDHGDPQTINNADGDGWKAPLWRALEESGLTLAWVSEEAGGAGAGLAAGFDILHVSGRYAVSVPLTETLLAGWLLETAGLAVPQGALTIAGCGRDKTALGANGTLSGTLHAVPFASNARHIAVLAKGRSGSEVALVETASCHIMPATTIAGDPCADATLNDTPVVASAPTGADADTLMLMGATTRARQMAGALQAILDLSVAYAQERVAFERPIAKFQAVQHNLARLAGEVAAADAVSGSAADAIVQSGPTGDDVFLEAASAKIRTGEAAGEGATIAHQVFGAIGFTDEHVLHRFTRRLWAWRDSFGSESVWAERLGHRVAAAGPDALWPMLAAQ